MRNLSKRQNLDSININNYASFNLSHFTRHVAINPHYRLDQFKYSFYNRMSSSLHGHNIGTSQIFTFSLSGASHLSQRCSVIRMVLFYSDAAQAPVSYSTLILLFLWSFLYSHIAHLHFTCHHGSFITFFYIHVMPLGVLDQPKYINKGYNNFDRTS